MSSAGGSGKHAMLMRPTFISGNTAQDLRRMKCVALISW